MDLKIVFLMQYKCICMSYNIIYSLLNSPTSSSSEDDSPVPVKKRQGLRRNSISMPVGLNKVDSDAIQQHHLDQKLYLQV